MLKWTKPVQFVLSACVTFQGHRGRPPGSQLFQGNSWTTRCQKLCHFCFLLLGRKFTTWCWERAAWEGTVPYPSWEKHTALSRDKDNSLGLHQALWSLLLFLKWKSWLKPGLEQGPVLEGCRRRSRTQRKIICALSHVYSGDLPIRKELNRHIAKFWAHQILTVWALPGLNGDNSTIFMLLMQGYKYRLVLFSVISKYGEIDEVFMVKDNILNTVPLDWLQWLLLSCRLALTQSNRPINKLLLLYLFVPHCPRQIGLTCTLFSPSLQLL